MSFSPSDFLAIVLAALANFGVGMFWYSPAGFMKTWMKAMKGTFIGFEDRMKHTSMVKTMGLGLAGTLLQSLVLLMIIRWYTLTPTWWEGAFAAFWMWLGFVFVTQVTSYVYEHNSRTIFTVGTTYQLVAMVVMGAVLGALT